MQDKATIHAPEYSLNTVATTGISPVTASFLTDGGLFNLLITTKTQGLFAKSSLDQRAAQKLLGHVVLGEEAKARDMIAANPGLLLITSKAVDYSGRTVIATPFQAALGAGDKPMWEMMRPYIGKEEALRQFHNWFPEGIEEAPTVAVLKPKYHAIAKAIIDDVDKGKSAIESFREEITRQKKIKHGKHFNLNHLVAAYAAYIDNFEALDSWDNRDSFWRKVIGYVQRQMTAYDAEVHCFGIKDVLNNAASFSRSLKLGKGGTFFPLVADAGLGFEFACFSYAPARRARTRAGWGGDSGNLPVQDLVALENYITQKTEALADLKESLESGVSYSL